MSGRLPLLALLCATQFLLVLDVTIVSVALPSIRAGLRLDTAELQWVVSAYVLAFGGLLLPAGRVCDLLGRRRVFMAGLATVAAGSFACALAPAGSALVAARGVQGAGAALATPAALALVTTTFGEGRERTRALGAWTAAAPVGGATGLLLGGLLTQHLGWPHIFVLCAGLALAALLAAPAVLPADAATPARARPRLDLPGALTGTAAVSALVFALSRAERAGFADPPAMAAAAAAVAMAVAFASWERRAADPLLPPGTLVRAGLRRAVLVSLALTAATSPPLFFIVLHLQVGLGWSASATGLTCLPLVAAVIAGAGLAPRAIGRHGTTMVMAGGLALIAAGTAVLIPISGGGAVLATMLPGQALYGAGLGAGSVAATAAGTAALSDDEQGAGAGLLSAAAQVGTALGLAALVAVAGVADTPVAGMRAAFAVDAAFAALVAVALSVRAVAPQRRTTPAAPPPRRTGSAAASIRSSPRNSTAATAPSSSSSTSVWP